MIISNRSAGNETHMIGQPYNSANSTFTPSIKLNFALSTLSLEACLLVLSAFSHQISLISHHKLTRWRGRTPENIPGVAQLLLCAGRVLITYLLCIKAYPQLSSAFGLLSMPKSNR